MVGAAVPFRGTGRDDRIAMLSSFQQMMLRARGRSGRIKAMPAGPMETNTLDGAPPDSAIGAMSGQNRGAGPLNGNNQGMMQP